MKPSKQTNNIGDKGTLILSTVFMLFSMSIGKIAYSAAYHPLPRSFISSRYAFFSHDLLKNISESGN